jgi:hypothetical protein
MPERIYRLLLHLYPSQFRQSYGEEAVQLFRDRMRDETGFFRRSRLWLDLLLDLGSLRLRGYREAAVVPAAASAQGGSGRAPSFASLERSALEFRFVFWGGVLSVVLCGAALFALEHGGGHLPPSMFPSNAFVVSAKSTPKIVFSYEANEPGAGAEVRLHAVVSGDGGEPVPTGKVSFLYGWNGLVTGTLVNGSVTMDAKLPKGKRLPLNALYLGDSNYRSITSLEKTR